MKKKNKRIKKQKAYPGVVDIPDPNVHVPEQVSCDLARATLLYEYVHGPKTFEENSVTLMHELRTVVEKLALLFRTTKHRMVKDYQND